MSLSQINCEQDACGAVMAACLQAFDPPIADTAVTLDLGCAEFNWLRRARDAWPRMTLVGLDWRAAPPVAGVDIRRGDARDVAHFAPDTFDWIVSISAMEHMGLHHYDGDPADPDGDMVVFRNVFTWLKPGGWFYFDVPWNAGTAYQVCGTSHRIYDHVTLQSRCHQWRAWRQVWRAYAGHSGQVLQMAEPAPLKPGRFYYCANWWQKDT